jgi:OmpA-OmpF porin, OOP family
MLKEGLSGSRASKKNFLTFSIAKTNVKAMDKKELAKVAKVLNANSSAFDRVEVLGYADISGTKQFNDKLSLKRALEVKTALMKAGLKNITVETIGEGEANSSKVISTDRRADIKFIGVKDADGLKKALSKIR